MNAHAANGWGVGRNPRPLGALAEIVTRDEHRATLLATALAAVLAAAYLLAPQTGQDLAAQLARADFARAHPFAPVDLRWFGGVSTFGYSLWVPQVMALVGVRLFGAICSVLATAAVTELFRRTSARRPLLGGLAAALTQTLNLVDGRFAFTAGMVCGLGALLCLVRADDRARRLVWTGVLAALAGGASPVAALLLWVCGGALVLTARIVEGAVITSASAGPVVLSTVLFGDGGTEPFLGKYARAALLATAAVLVAAPRGRPVLRVGAALGIVMVIAVDLVDTPIGNNATRLSLLFAAPVILAYGAWRWWLVPLPLAATVYQQTVDYHYALTWGPSAEPGYYAPLLAELHARGPLTGRVEVPETNSHFDAAYLAREVPLARGWERQLDVELNGPVFFDGPMPVPAYRQFLAANSVEYVAVPDDRTTAAGSRERVGIRRGLPFLTEVWHNAHWHLYAVKDPRPIVRAPGHMTSLSPASVVLTAPAHARVTVQIRWSRWLTLDDGDHAACIAPDGPQRVQLRTDRGGSYRIGSTLLGPAGHC